MVLSGFVFVVGVTMFRASVDLMDYKRSFGIGAIVIGLVVIYGFIRLVTQGVYLIDPLKGR